MYYLLFLSFFLLYLLYNLSIRRKINNSSILDAAQKRRHHTLIWAIPFLWAFVVHQILKEEIGVKVMTKKTRKVLLKKDQRNSGKECQSY